MHAYSHHSHRRPRTGINHCTYTLRRARTLIRCLSTCRKPDPDSIAKPGELADRRFKKDPFEEQRKATYKKKNKMYNIPAHVTASLKTSYPSSSPPTNSAKPTAATRNVNGNSVPLPFLNSPAHAATTPSPYRKSITRTAKAGIDVSATTKGTMETLTMSSVPMYQSRMPVTVMARTDPPAKKGMPTWAASIEKLLVEENTKVEDQRAPPFKTSLPPHLRKTRQATNDTTSSAGFIPQNPCPSAATKQAETLVNVEDELHDEALAWKLATTGLGVDDAKQVGNLSNLLCHALTFERGYNCKNKFSRHTMLIHPRSPHPLSNSARMSPQNMVVF